MSTLPPSMLSKLFFALSENDVKFNKKVLL